MFNLQSFLTMLSKYWKLETTSIGSSLGTRWVGTRVSMCEYSDGRTATVFVILQLIAKLSFLQQLDRVEHCGEVKPILREKSHIVDILQISHQ